MNVSGCILFIACLSTATATGSPDCLAQGHRNLEILYIEKFSFYLTESKLVHCKEQTGDVV
jgi:hypothetical protein